MLQKKKFTVSKFDVAEKKICCFAYDFARKTDRAKNFLFRIQCCKKKDRAKKLINITINQSVGVGQGRVDFSSVKSLIDVDQGRARIYFSYKPC